MSRNITRKLFKLRIFLFLIAIISKNSEELEFEGSVIKCEDSSRSLDEQVVNWKPTPITFIDNEAFKVGPHSSKSALLQEIQNQIKSFSLKQCNSKLVLSLKVSGFEKPSDSDLLLLVPHVKNELTGRTGYLGNPVALKIYQTPILQAYPIKFLYKVNAKAYEEVINKDSDSMYEGCDVSSHGTANCSPSKDRPNSVNTGFCCQCMEEERVHPRGGQKCTEKVETLQEARKRSSKHCFRNSKFWYGVHELEEPVLYHKLFAQIYYATENKERYKWHRMSQNDMEMISMENPRFTSKDLVFEFRQKNKRLKSSGYFININSTRLLIPIPAVLSEYNETVPPALKGTAGDKCLIVPKSALAPKGKVCNRAGVGSEVFLSQPDKCEQPKGACLGNQPFDIWEGSADMSVSPKKDEKIGRLSMFAELHKHRPIRKLGGKMYLLVEHNEPEPFYVDFEINSENLNLQNPGYNLGIYSVASDCGNFGAKILVQVINKDNMNVPSVSVQLIKCTDGVPSQKTQALSISANGFRSFTIDIHHDFSKLLRTANCLVILMNQYEEAIAAREILISLDDTCLCVHLCDCSCVKESIKCLSKMTLPRAIAAGLKTS